jgi:hypothetical protein
MRHLCALLLCLFALQGFSQNPSAVSTAGTDFYACFMENLEFGISSNGRPRFSVLISAEQQTRIRIENQSFVIDALLDSAEVREFFLDPALLMYLEGSDLQGPFGVRIKSDFPIQVKARHYRLYFSESTLVLPLSSWGSEYRAMAFLDDAAAGGGLESCIAIVAAQDSTDVEIVPSALVEGSPGRAAEVPYTVRLNAGAVYQLQSSNDLSGTRIRALGGKKVGVFSGSRISLADFCSASSHLYDQQYPLDSWGTTFPLLPLEGEGGDFFRVLTQEDNTRFTVGCESYFIEKAYSVFTFLCSAPALLQSDKPLTVGQITRGARCNDSALSGDNFDSDPSLLMLPPLGYGSKVLRFSRPEQFGYNNLPPKSFLHIVVPAAAAASLRQNGASLAQPLLPLPSNSAYRYAIIPVQTPTVELRADAELWALAFMVDDLETMSEHLGYTTRRALLPAPVTSLPNTLDFIPADTICPFEPLRFAPPANVVYQQLAWDFGNGQRSNANINQIQYTQAGTYTVTLRLWPDNCAAPRDYQQQITVLPCPVPPFSPLQLIVEGDCVNRPVRVRYSPSNITPLPPYTGVLSASGVGGWSDPDYTFTLNFGQVDSFGLQINAHYVDPWGRDTFYSFFIPQKPCYDDFSGDFIRVTGNCAGLPVRFEYVNAFSAFVGNRVVFHRWDFGVPERFGDTSRLALPSYVFERPGDYTVSVQVIKQFGDTATLQLPLRIADCANREPEPPNNPDAAQPCALRFYPNPFVNTLNLLADDSDNLPLEVFDLAGRLIGSYTVSAGALPRNWDALPSGVYLFRYPCAASNSWTVQRMIKMAN